MKRHILLLASVLTFAAALHAQSTPCQGGQAFDDGTAELFPPYGFYHGPVTDHFVSRFTPPSYPYHYERACVGMVSIGGPGQASLELVVFDDDGAFGGAGAPGTLLAAVPVQAALQTTTTWVSAELGCVTVTSGSVWIGARWNAGTVAVGLDTAHAHAYRYSGDGFFWSTSFRGEHGALLARALGAPGDSSALAQPRNGSGVNPPLYSADPPRIGTTWSARVDHTGRPGVIATQVLLFASGTSGFFVPQGELLVNLASGRLFVSTRASSSDVDLHAAAIPADSALVGLNAASQALILAPGHAVLCNAVDLRVGC